MRLLLIFPIVLVAGCASTPQERDEGKRDQQVELNRQREMRDDPHDRDELRREMNQRPEDQLDRLKI